MTWGPLRWSTAAASAGSHLRFPRPACVVTGRLRVIMVIRGPGGGPGIPVASRLSMEAAAGPGQVTTAQPGPGAAASAREPSVPGPSRRRAWAGSQGGQPLEVAPPISCQCRAASLGPLGSTGSLAETAGPADSVGSESESARDVPSSWVPSFQSQFWDLGVRLLNSKALFSCHVVLRHRLPLEHKAHYGDESDERVHQQHDRGADEV